MVLFVVFETNGVKISLSFPVLYSRLSPLLSSSPSPLPCPAEYRKWRTEKSEHPLSPPLGIAGDVEACLVLPLSLALLAVQGWGALGLLSENCTSKPHIECYKGQEFPSHSHLTCTRSHFTYLCFGKSRFGPGIH